jgi:hypothetical protein
MGRAEDRRCGVGGALAPKGESGNRAQNATADPLTCLADEQPRNPVFRHSFQPKSARKCISGAAIH